MPYFLEVISFDTLRHDDALFGAVEKFAKTPSELEFDVVGRLDGCVGIVGGYEVEDNQRAYVISAWTSYEAYSYTCNTCPVLSIVNPALKSNPHGISNIRVYHLTVDMHPYRTLSAPVTELALISQRSGRIFTAKRAWKQSVDVCVAGLKAGLYAVDGAHPPLLWGEIKQDPGNYLMLVGWDGVEAHTKAVRQPSLRRHVVDILKATHVRAVHAKLRSLISIDTTGVAAQADASADIGNATRSGREILAEGKFHTSM